MSPPDVHERIAHMARSCAGVNLRRASRAVTRYYDGLLLQACGLRTTQVTPLVVLYLAGPQTTSEIAGHLDLDRTTLTRNLKLLQDMNLIKIEPGADQRTRRVTLSKHGANRLLKALPVWEEAQAQVVQGIGEKQFHTLLAQLATVAEFARER